MNSSSVRRVAAVLSCLFAGAVLTAQTAQVPKPFRPKTARPSPALHANFGQLPLSFEQNVGQTAPSVQWIARGPESTLYLSGNDATVQINHPEKTKVRGIEQTIDHSASLRMSLLSARAARSTVGEALQSGKANYFTGNDSSRWQRNLPLYGQVRLNEVYPGISLLYHGEHGRLEYDFVVAPKADPSSISLSFAGATPSLDANGDLVLPITGDTRGESTVHFDKPVVYQTLNGVRKEIESGYQLASNGHITFRLGAYDHSRELVIDPTLVYTGTATTGSESDQPNGMAVDPSGELIIAGTTRDLDFPATPGAYQTSCGPISSQATAIGATRCAVGNQSSMTSAYILKLSADGTRLIYATYLHGLTGGENGAAVQSDASGNAVVIGQTSSNDFPLVNAPSIPQMSECQPYYASYTGTPGASASTCDGYNAGGGTEYTIGGPSGFVSKVSADGSKLLYSAFLGYTGATYPQALALDSSGNMYIASNLVLADKAPNPGAREVFYYTTSNALQAYGVGDQEIGFTILSADGQTVKYSTIFGESAPTQQGCGSCLGGTVASGIATGPNGTVYLAGETASTLLPGTSGAAVASCFANSSVTSGTGAHPLCLSNSGFVAAFDITKSQPFLWTTYVSSGTNTNNAASTTLNSVAADAQGNAYVTGFTTDALFPLTTGAYATTCAVDTRSGANFCDDTIFVTKISSTGKSFDWSTFLNPTQNTSSSANANAIALDAKGNIYIYGDSGGGTMPAVNPVTQYPNNWYQPYPFISVLDPTGTKVLFSSQVAPAGNGSPGPASMHNGLAVDTSGNIYVVGLTNAGKSFSVGSTTLTTWPTTKGTYTTAYTGTGTIPFFAKVSAILPAPSNSLTISPTSTSTGQPVTFTIEITGPNTSPIPTGSVDLNYTTASNSTPTLLKNIALSGTGKDTYTTTSLAAGTYTFTAVYSGDSNYDTNNSSAATVTITTPQSAAVTLTSSGSPVAAGANVTFTAKATGGSGVPTGTVTFLNGASTLGTGTLNSSGVATFTTSFSKGGSYSITASYGGDTTYSTAVSSALTEVVNATTATVTLASSASTASSGYSVTFTSTISGTGSTAPTGKVTFFDGTTTLGTGTIASGNATYSTSSLAVGSHSITASYGGDSNYGTAVSTALTETIVTPSFKVGYSPNPVIIKQGSSGTTTITVTPGAAYSGTVTLGCNGSSIFITCSFAPASMSWTSSNSTSAQTAVITIQTTAPHAAAKTASIGMGTWLGSLMGCLSLIVLTRKRKLIRATRTLTLLIFLLGSVGALAGLTGCGGGGQALLGGTPTGAQSLSITFNGNDDGTPLSITVQ